ncbi:MAG: HD family hydrolase [Desulfurococcales archaeon]|nr:HD family hydrolase [Desulfurococcales archaeon]
MDIVEIAGSLKWLARTGWMQRGVPSAIAENVSQHSFETAVIALDLAYRLNDYGITVDPLKASVLALIHDLAESVVGDIPKWSSSRMSGLKEELEASAVEGANLHASIKELFEEYNNESSLEASIAKVSDYVSTCIQARRYFSIGYGVNTIYSSMKDAAEMKASSCCPQIYDYIKYVCNNSKR